MKPFTKDDERIVEAALVLMDGRTTQARWIKRMLEAIRYNRTEAEVKLNDLQQELCRTGRCSHYHQDRT